MKPNKTNIDWLTKMGDGITFFVKSCVEQLNPNWHEAGHFYPPCNFGIGFCQLNLYQKFRNFFGGEN